MRGAAYRVAEQDWAQVYAYLREREQPTETYVENRAAVRLAQIDLANTRIVAPRSGRLGEIGVRQGQYVTAGSQLMGLVPDVVWVTANMKETQMRDIRVGQPVTVTVDALGGQELTGRVERIAPAAGSEFSVIRPDNATGNYTKVAEGLNVAARRVEKPAELGPAIEKALKIDRPVIIDVVTDIDALAPLAVS